MGQLEPDSDLKKFWPAQWGIPEPRLFSWEVGVLKKCPCSSMFSHCIVVAWETEMHSALTPGRCSEVKAGGCELAPVLTVTSCFCRELKEAPPMLPHGQLKTGGLGEAWEAHWFHVFCWFRCSLYSSSHHWHRLSPQPLNFRWGLSSATTA